MKSTSTVSRSNRYYVYYVERCEPKLKSFRSQESMRRFKVKFLSLHKNNRDDNWIDFTFFGKLLSQN